MSEENKIETQEELKTATDDIVYYLRFGYSNKPFTLFKEHDSIQLDDLNRAITYAKEVLGNGLMFRRETELYFISDFGPAKTKKHAAIIQIARKF